MKTKKEIKEKIKRLKSEHKQIRKGEKYFVASTGEYLMITTALNTIENVIENLKWVIK